MSNSPESAAERAQDLIRALSEDLSPVRPMPKVRTLTAVVLAIWLLTSLAGAWAVGMRPDFWDMLLMEKGVAGVFLALGLAGAGGVLASIAVSVPGREAASRMGFALGAVGIALAAGIASVMIVNRPDNLIGAPFSGHLTCLTWAAGAALLPALATVVLVGRAAAPMRPLVAALAAGAGTAALSALAAMSHCTHDDPLHLMLGHVLAPALCAALLLLPLLWAMRRFSER